MSAVFDALPGICVPVGEINQRLEAMWVDTAASGGAAPTAEEAKATQLNFILHLGFNTTPEDGQKQFQTVVRLAQRYPSRIVVLCPIADETHSGTEMRAKIYGECFLGKSKSDKRCVEFVLLSYPMVSRRYLEDQVSICLSADLPLYYWAHRFSQTRRLADYRFLLTRAKRVMLDSAIFPEGSLSYPWPNPDVLRDLAFARTLPVRQSIGQFMTSYKPELLAGGLRSVTVSHSGDLVAEGRALLGWLQQRLKACNAADDVTFDVTTAETPMRNLGIQFAYDGNDHAFRWSGDLATQQALFEAKYEDAVTSLPAAVSLLSPEASLSEAMFF